MICDCKFEPICDDCLKEHAGADHKKIFVQDINKTFPSMLQKKLTEADNFHKGFKNSTSGRFFEGYVEFFENALVTTETLRGQYD